MKECLENVRRKAPLVHNITNYVTVNDVANVILAIGASPIMADDREEVEEITDDLWWIEYQYRNPESKNHRVHAFGGKKSQCSWS